MYARRSDNSHLVGVRIHTHARIHTHIHYLQQITLNTTHNIIQYNTMPTKYMQITHRIYTMYVWHLPSMSNGYPQCYTNSLQGGHPSRNHPKVLVELWVALSSLPPLGPPPSSSVLAAGGSLFTLEVDAPSGPGGCPVWATTLSS